MSRKIKYELWDGEIVELEVSNEFAEEYAKLEKEEQQRRWREKKRWKKEISLDWLMSMGIDFPDPVNRSPEELYIEREEAVVSILGDLTEYQKRVAIKFYVDQKSISQIAKEEGVSRQAISNLMNKVKRKIVSQFS